MRYGMKGKGRVRFGMIKDRDGKNQHGMKQEIKKKVGIKVI